jgi:predicted CxxxxCH...CXXCH cytochrome family protein
MKILSMGMKQWGRTSLQAAVLMLLLAAQTVLAASPLLHSSDNLGTKYGTWGTTFTCATCHTRSTSNIKKVSQTIATPTGSRPVVFTRLSTSLTGAAATGIFGDDQRTTNLNGSQNICEVCHHQTKYHQYSSSKVAVTTHQNRRDCIQCHAHGKAFAASCNTCHGYPPNNAALGVDGLATPATNALQAGQGGAHVAHTNAATFAMVCETCHNGYTSNPMGDNRIEIGFSINKSTYPAFSNGTSNKGTYYGNSGIAASYTWRASASGTTISQSAGGESCSVYCHGNWPGANGSIAAPSWGITDGSQKACGTCHGTSASQPPATGSHSRHAGNGSGGLSVACINCHGAVLDNTHVDGKVAWNVGGLSGAPTANYRSAASGNTGTIAPSSVFGSCSNLYCHSNVQGTTGTGAPTSTAAPVWGASSVACNSCHGSPMATGSHTTHTTTYSFICDTCHSGAGAGTAKHADGHIDIAISQGKYSSAYPSGYKVAGSKAYSSCQNTACHAGAATSPTWGNSGSVAGNCQGCHGNETNATAALSGAHNNHLNKATTGGGFRCKDCHVATITNTDNRTLANRALHANGYINYTGANSGKQTVATGSHVSCASFYCHSNGKGTYSTIPAWTSGSVLACNGCHGTTNGAGYPDYASGGSGAYTANSHQKHNPAATDCWKCHRTTASSTAGQLVSGATDHLDRVVNARLGNINAAFTSYSGVYATSGKTCSATYCHGGTNGATVAWGAVGGTNCTSCHSAKADDTYWASNSAHKIHYAATTLPSGSYYNYSGNMSSATTYRFTCGSCHSGTKGAVHANGPASASQAAQVFYAFTSATMKGSYTAGTLAGSTDRGFNWTAGGTGCNTTYCHSNGQGANGLTTVSWSTNASSGTCVQCHDTKQTSVASGLSAKHDKHMNPSQNSIMGLNNGFNCIDCHAKTVSNNTTIANKSKHVNKFMDFSSARGGGSAKYNAGTKTCSSIYCHSNGNPGSLVYVNPTWTGAALSCNGCHGTSGFGGPDYANGGAGTATANSHPAHVTKLSVTSTTGCALCHVKTVDQATANKFKDYTAASYHLNGGPNVVFQSLGGKTGSVTYAGYSVTCANTYCHGSATSDAWGTVGPLACNKCHNAKADDANWAAGGAHKIHYAATTLPSSYTNYSGNMSSTTTYRFTCGSCHSPAKGSIHANGPANANGVAQVLYAYTSATMKGSYTYGAAGGTDNGFNWSAGGTGCNTTYCHSNGQGANGLTTVSWSTNASSGTCVQCHDTKQTTVASGLSAKHDKHMNPSQNSIMGLNNGFNCIDCHAKTVSNNTTIANKSKHVNKFVDFSSARGGGSAKYNASTKTCSSIYCHSNGNPGALVYVNPTWTGAALSCNGCHGTSGFGGPDYTNGGAGTATANNHPKHISALGITDTTGCTICHIKTANGTTANKFKDYSAASYHLNGTPNVYFNKTKAGAAATYTASGATCSNILCHSNGAGTYQTGLVWGGTDNCAFCHPISGLSATHAKHIDTTLIPAYYTYTANRSTTAAYNFGCSNCHPVTNGSHMTGTILIDFRPGVAGVGTLRSKNAVAITAGSVVAGTTNSGTTGTSGSSVKCLNVYCHSNGYASNPVYATTPDWYGGSFTGDKCANCHGNSPNATIAGSASHSAHVVAMHYNNVYSGTGGLLSAGTSNAPHGSATEATTYNCNICHNTTVTSSANDGNTVCAGCHYSGNTVGATLKGAATIANKGNHVNGLVDISFQSVAVVSKAQLRQSTFTNVTSVSNYWSRNGGTNYKNGATAFDTAKSALSNTMWTAGGTCSTTACHNGKSVNWYNDAGQAAQCTMCHVNL